MSNETKLGGEDERKFDRLHIRKSDRSEYTRLLGRDSLFAGKDNKDLFMMAMITGFYNKNRITLEGQKEGYILISYLSPKELSVIRAIAIAEEGNLDILLDKERLHGIIEEYAAGGIGLLKDEVLGSDLKTYIRLLESKLVDEFDKLELEINKPENFDTN